MLHEVNFYVTPNRRNVDSGRLINIPRKIAGDFNCGHLGLTSLVGGPEEVGGYYYADNNKITSLVGIAPIIQSYLSLDSNNISSLIDVHKHLKLIGNSFYLNRNPELVEGGLGLLLIKSLKHLYCSDIPPITIINRYLKEDVAAGKKIFKCQKELVDAGYEEYAKL